MNKYPFKKILITGGSGFIGSTYIEKILNEFTGFEILNLDKMSYASSALTNDLFTKNSNFNFLKLDISNSIELSHAISAFTPDLIINFAAESHVDNSIASSSEFIQSNIIGTYNLLQHAQKLSKSNEDFLFHHISTDEVYGDLDFHQDAFTEESQYKPSSPYSSSKASSDLLVMSWGRTYKIPYLITNCSNNYGPRQFLEKFIPKIIRNLINNDLIPVFGKGENIRDWIFVEDHIDAIFSLHSHECRNEIYNIGGNDEKSNLDLVSLIIKKMTELPEITIDSDPIEFIEDRKGHDLRYAINSSKIQTAIGWKPTTSFDSGISKTIDWYLNNIDWWESR